MSAIFTISTDAAAWIDEALNQAKKDANLAELVPILGVASGYAEANENGKLLELYSAEFFDLGLDSAEVATGLGYTDVEIAGQRIFVTPEALERLKGKQLTVQTVQVGVQEPGAQTRQLLVAIALENPE